MKDELESVLDPHWKEATKDAQKVLVTAGGIGLVVSGAFWLWSDSSYFGSHEFFCAIWGGLTAFVIWMLAGMPEPRNSVAPDDLLQQVAALTFIGSAANELRDALRRRGFVTLGEISEAFHNERIARRSQQSLEQPGAKAFLGN
jgi:predicted benzoate:H+ symporter BenE